MQEENNPNQLQIELSEEMAEGIYSNLAIITHSNSEFVIDFVRVMPGVPKAKENCLNARSCQAFINGFKR
jgi:hypothetical protein